MRDYLNGFIFILKVSNNHLFLTKLASCLVYSYVSTQLIE